MLLSILPLLFLLPPVSQAFDQLLLHDSFDVQRLIKLFDDDPGTWMSQDDINVLIRHNKRFMDVTDTVALRNEETSLRVPTKPNLPKTLSNTNMINSINTHRVTDFMRVTLQDFTEFYTRYYRSKTGEASSKYLLDVIQSIEDVGNAAGANITVNTFKHSWPQSSIIATFHGDSDNDEERDQVVIVGAHQDSVNMWIPALGRAPGADDDGSGTVTILDAFKVLAESGFQPSRTVEFHWYAAEEAGLLGSQAVAEAYRRQGRPVVSMLQSDMTGYSQDPPVYGIVTDHVDEELTEFLKKLIKVTLKGRLPVRELQCGYACSDHASWGQAGYRSAFHFEADELHANPNVHTSKDTVKTLDFDHMLEFSKVVVAYAVELGDPAPSEE